MPLLISLSRDAQKVDLGGHDAVELVFDELHIAGGGRVLARHRHNRWMPAERPEPYSHLEIQGPLTVAGSGPDDRILGPYLVFSTFDGVAYVDRRVFAFTDVQQRDWYMHDVGKHWSRIRISFHTTGP